MNRKELGSLGEQFATHYLQQQGLEIVARNWRCSSGELDIIALDQTVLVFIEVRTRSVYADRKARYGSVLEAITPYKQLQIRKLAEIYLYQKKLYERKIRFDVVLIERQQQEMKATHIRHAF
jgi:putative endonuclease